jgi:uncharacterized membrane protein (UPF0127 family)
MKENKEIKIIENKRMIKNKTSQLMIKNKTKKFAIIKKARLCTSVFSQGFGFMLHKKPDYALVFAFSKERLVPITMFLVFFKLDLLFLDKNKKVVEIVRGLKPFTGYTPKAKAQYVVELPVGVLGKTEVGDDIIFLSS